MALPWLLVALVLTTPALARFARRGDVATVMIVIAVTIALTAGLANV